MAVSVQKLRYELDIAFSFRRLLLGHNFIEQHESLAYFRKPFQLSGHLVHFRPQDRSHSLVVLYLQSQGRLLI